MPSIVLLHADPLIGAQLAAAIRSITGMQLAGWARTLAQTRPMIEHGTADLVLASLRLEDGWSTRLMDEIRGPGRKGGPLLVVLAESLDDPNLMLALQHGADGYVVQGRGRTAMAAALQLVLGGGSPMAPEIARQMASRFGGESGPLQLTERERLMLDDIASGCSMRDIAQKLQVSEAQVNVRVRNLYRKLQFDLRAGTLQLAAA